MTAAQGSILVVDDDHDLAASIARMLCRHNLAAIACCDPAVLLEAAPVMQPCCIVCDVMMGPLNGFDLARRLRAAISSAAIIFMTAWPRTSDAVMAIRDPRRHRTIWKSRSIRTC